MKKSTLLMLLCATIFLIASCTSDEEEQAEKLNTNSLTLKAGQSSKLIYDGSCIWQSQEPLIADVDNDGNVYAKRVGETVILANDESCNVRVTPNYNTYIEPCMQWGVSMAYIEDYMKDFKSHGQVDNILAFEDALREIAYIYSFESNMLQQSIIVAKLSKAYEIADFLLERYLAVDVDMDNYAAAFLSIDKKNAVFLIFIEELITVVYMPYDSSSNNINTAIATTASKLLYNKQTAENAVAISMLKKVEAQMEL